MSTAVATQPAPQKTFDQTGSFDQLFYSLLNFKILSEKNYCTQPHILSMLSQQLTRNLLNELPRLHQLERHPCYSRHILGHYKNWVGLACRWEKGAVSSIHAHPAFTFYTVADGSFTMEIYQKTKARQIELKEVKILTQGEHIWEMGVEGRYDNLIHRVIANQPGLTLQLFSDDPTLGEVYS